MLFPSGGMYPGNNQQQMAQMAQQQERQQQIQAQQALQAQQAMQAQQHGMQSFPKSQQDFLGNFAAQNLQTMMGQGNSSMHQNMPGTQFNPFPMMPQMNQPPQMSTLPNLGQQSNTSNAASMISEMIAKAKAGLLTPVQLAQVCILSYSPLSA